MTLCDQCGSCCIQLKSIADNTREDFKRWVKEKRIDILQFCDGWHDKLKDDLILCEEKAVVDYFMDNLHDEMWFDPKTGNETGFCPFLSVNSNEKKFMCQIQDMKPSICKEYHCSPSEMLGIIKKPFEENLKEYRNERRYNHSVKSAPNRLIKANKPNSVKPKTA